MDFREGRLSSRLVHWIKSKFLRKQKFECSAHELQPNSEPVESHTYSISLRYVRIYLYSHEVSWLSPPLRIASQNLVIVYVSAMCPAWPRCIHLRSFTFSSDSEYKLWTLFCRLLHSHVCFFKSEHSCQLLCVKALPIYVLPSRDQISHPYRQKQNVS
jgi:hypothetical protein